RSGDHLVHTVAPRTRGCAGLHASVARADVLRIHRPRVAIASVAGLARAAHAVRAGAVVVAGRWSAAETREQTHEHTGQTALGFGLWQRRMAPHTRCVQALVCKHYCRAQPVRTEKSRTDTICLVSRSAKKLRPEPIRPSNASRYQTSRVQRTCSVSHGGVHDTASRSPR